MTINNEKKPSKRNEEITKDYFSFLDLHIENVANGTTSNFMELNQIAKSLHISHSNLSDTIQQTMGHHPCYYYDLKIIEVAKQLLISSDLPIAETARKLTYDPSNFSKFFKKWTGMTPGEFKKRQKKF